MGKDEDEDGDACMFRFYGTNLLSKLFAGKKKGKGVHACVHDMNRLHTYIHTHIQMLKKRKKNLN